MPFSSITDLPGAFICGLLLPLFCTWQQRLLHWPALCPARSSEAGGKTWRLLEERSAEAAGYRKSSSCGRRWWWGGTGKHGEAEWAEAGPLIEKVEAWSPLSFLSFFSLSPASPPPPPPPHPPTIPSHSDKGVKKIPSGPIGAVLRLIRPSFRAHSAPLSDGGLAPSQYKVLGDICICLCGLVLRWVWGEAHKRGAGKIFF